MDTHKQMSRLSAERTVEIAEDIIVEDMFL